MMKKLERRAARRLYWLDRFTAEGDKGAAAMAKQLWRKAEAQISAALDASFATLGEAWA